MKFHFGWPYESGVRIDVNLNIFTGNIIVTQNNRPAEKLAKNKVSFTDEQGISHILEVKNRFIINPLIYVDGYEIVVFRKLPVQNIIAIFFPVLILFNIFDVWSGIVAVILTVCGMYVNLLIAKRYDLFQTKCLIFCALSAAAFYILNFGIQYLLYNFLL